MLQKVFLSLCGVLAGILLGYFLLYKPTSINFSNFLSPIIPAKRPQKQVLGFLPFWLIDKAQDNYQNVTTLNYFDLTIDTDGTIVTHTNPKELDPGWHALASGKVDSYLQSAKQAGKKLSLTVFNANDDSIDKLLSDPKTNAQNLVNAAMPIMNQYGFSDLNLDVEQVRDASPSARANYAQFVAEVKKGLSQNKSLTLTVDISPIAFLKDTNLADPGALAPNVDYIVLMAYDFHNQGSQVTGPVSPEAGAGITSEFDTEASVDKALSIVPPEKIILGIPLYGYEWETINQTPRSATVPASATLISNSRAENFLASCTNCIANFDSTDQEENVIYKDTQTGTFHQIFYPTDKFTKAKVDFANSKNLGGIALWALGYDGPTILQPISKLGATK